MDLPYPPNLPSRAGMGSMIDHPLATSFAASGILRDCALPSAAAGVAPDVPAAESGIPSAATGSHRSGAAVVAVAASAPIDRIAEARPEVVRWRVAAAAAKGRVERRVASGAPRAPEREQAVPGQAARAAAAAAVGRAQVRGRVERAFQPVQAPACRCRAR